MRLITPTSQDWGGIKSANVWKVLTHFLVAGLVTVVILRTQLPSQHPHLLPRELARGEAHWDSPVPVQLCQWAPQLPGDQQPIGDVMMEVTRSPPLRPEWLGHRTWFCAQCTASSEGAPITPGLT